MTGRNLNGGYNVGQADYRVLAVVLMIIALVLTALTTLLTQYALTHGYYEENPIRNTAFAIIGYYLPYIISSGVIIGGTFLLLWIDKLGKLSTFVNVILVVVFTFDFLHDATLLFGIGV
jgi:hypothetical protein